MPPVASLISTELAVSTHGAIHDQRLVLYKPYDERSAYLLGTRNGVVPRRKQIVCVGEFKVTRLPDYFRLIREQGSRIEVEAMRFPIRKTFTLIAEEASTRV